jgi:transcriptional regulator with XRE-family HTH domain
MDHKKDIGTRIKTIRENLDLTQTEFGKAFNLTKQTILNYEKGYRFPDESFLINLILKYKINCNWLLTGLGDIYTDSNEGNEKEKLLKNLVPQLKDIHLPIAIEIIESINDPFVLLRLSSYLEVVGLERDTLLKNADQKRKETINAT